ncbi:MAG: hypothetical protein Q9182_005579 [Xanthomendoza sp. 2 TL-2023]
MYLLSQLSYLAVVASHLLLTTAAPTLRDDPKTSELDQRGLISPVPACSGVSTTNKRLFQINGKTQYFAGANAWWLGHLQKNEDVDTAVSQIAATGYKVARVWGFGTTNEPGKPYEVWYQVLNSSGQYFNLDPVTGIPRLDYALAAAHKHGLQLILPLLNNYDDLGGINTYTTAYGGSHNDFYTNPRAQTAYKAYLKFILNRYKHHPAIFSWELCNEPRCPGCPPSVITTWARDISAYIKSLDPAHLVALGDEGWLTASSATTVADYEHSYAYTGYEGVDFQANLAIPTLDYGTLHLYPHYWGYNFSWGNTWIEQHNAIGRALGKPVVLEEYAVPVGATDGEGRDRVGILRKWQETVVGRTSVAGDAVWQFGTRLPSGVMPLDQYAVFWNGSEGAEVGVRHAREMREKRGVATL